MLANVSAELWCTPGDGAEPALGQGGLSTSLNLCAGPCIAESGFVSGFSRWGKQMGRSGLRVGQERAGWL